ncbi:MAG: hypothetical protein AVDCRST_MAG93-6760 [uncultured Chloroflexia bacterium]|uniref:Uncharacterized protein n=1 Tax=uncultured Chloroflexia bacterium TaxID=1672391 RepID=A0A6J4LXB8_9CHLR|nr:MAG: hypothetical protein AVDCRST_MAG93-6760 [uncultured Chloroflexia bacterium]
MGLLPMRPLHQRFQQRADKAALDPSEFVTLGLLFALKGGRSAPLLSLARRQLPQLDPSSA